MDAEELAAPPFDSMNHIEQVRADAGRAIATAEALRKRVRESVAVLRQGRGRLQEERSRLRSLAHDRNSGRR